MLMPLDMHAHIEPGIAPVELDRLGACVVAVTRSLAEYADVARRQDRSVVWAAGCHPGLAKAMKDFSVESLQHVVAATPIIGEIGIDRTSRAPVNLQVDVFSKVLAVAVEVPRLLSIHSYRATDLVLEALMRYRPKGVLLHWWLGDEAETRAAVNLGAYFSLNAAQVKKWRALEIVPKERLLFETDHPFGDRRERMPRRPGNLSSVESQVANQFGLTAGLVREQTWRNLDRLATELSIHDMFPHQFQVQLLSS
jgi:TatD DNase family protein